MTDGGRVQVALEERDQQYRRYRAAKKADLEELFADPQYGDKLRKFGATLKHFGADDADNMVQYVAKSAHGWLRAASEDIRFAALQMVGYRIVRIRVRAGEVPFDDPMPGDEDDVYRLCKRELMP